MSKSVRQRQSVVVRLLDLNLPSNRFILTAFIFSTALVTGHQLVRGRPVLTGLALGLQAGFSVFLSWAIGRELDPDDPRSATVAALLGFAIFLTGPTQLGAVVALLFAVRIVLRSTGAPPNKLDLVWLTALGIYSARRPGGVPAAIALGAALVMDGRLPAPAPRIVSTAGKALLLLALAAAAYFGSLTPSWSWPRGPQWIVLAFVLLAMAGWRTPTPASTSDMGAEPLSRRRLVAASWLGLAAGIVTLLWIGGPSIPALVGLWAAVIAVSIHRRVWPSRLRTA
jgi:hypothetical protein